MSSTQTQGMQAQTQAQAQHWSGRRRWASAANSHARGVGAQQTQKTQRVQRVQTQKAQKTQKAQTAMTMQMQSAGRLGRIREGCEQGAAGSAAAVVTPQPGKAPAGAPSPRGSPASASTAASSALFSQTTTPASDTSSSASWSSPTSATPTSASSNRMSAEARSRIHERRISALRDCGNYAAADILERAVRRANGSGGGLGSDGADNDDEAEAFGMAAASANAASVADDASVLTFATEATDTVTAQDGVDADVDVHVDVDGDASDATDVHANVDINNVSVNVVNVGTDADTYMHATSSTNAGAQGALVTPEKTMEPDAAVGVVDVDACIDTPETVPVALLDSSLLDSSSSATSSPMGGSGSGKVVPEEQATEEEEEEEREEKARRDTADFQEAMRLAMAAAEAKVEAERIAAEKERAEAAERIAIVATTERSERIAAAEAESVRLRLLERQRRPSSSSSLASALVSAGSNEVLSIASDDGDGVDNGGACVEDANETPDGQEGTDEKDSNLSGSDCPLNYSMSSDGDGRASSEVSSPVRSDLPLVEDANTEPDQSSSPSSTSSSTRKKLWGKSARKSPSKKWGQSAQENTTSPASKSGTEEGGTDHSFSSRRSGIDDAIANLSERMFSAVSAALPPRHPATEAEQKVVDSLPRPDYLPGSYGRKDSDASAAPSLRSMASSATPVAGTGTRDVSSLWDTGADASSALSGGTNAREEDKMAFGDSGGVELSNLDRFEPEMARDLNLAGNAFHTTLKSRAMEHDATSSIDIEVGSMGEVEVFSPKISGRPTKDNGGKREGDLFMDCSPSGSSSRASRAVTKLLPSGCCSWCLRIPCPRKVKPVHALFLLIPIVSVMLYLCYVYFVQPNL